MDSLRRPESRVPGPEARPRQEGYTLVAIAIGMAILAILVMGVAPSVSMIMKREREQELLFRGKQYARALVLFRKQYGRLPNELKELYENRPRTIRKLWKEPICGCPDWHVIYQNSPDILPVGAAPGMPPGTPGPKPSPSPTPSFFDPASQAKALGPIVGVRSNVHEKALTEWRGQKYYDEWRFIMGDADRDTSAVFGPRVGLPPPGAPPFPPQPTPAPR